MATAIITRASVGLAAARPHVRVQAVDPSRAQQEIVGEAVRM